MRGELSRRLLRLERLYPPSLKPKLQGVRRVYLRPDWEALPNDQKAGVLATGLAFVFAGDGTLAIVGDLSRTPPELSPDQVAAAERTKAKLLRLASAYRLPDGRGGLALNRLSQ